MWNVYKETDRQTSGWIDGRTLDIKWSGKNRTSKQETFSREQSVESPPKKLTIFKKKFKKCLKDAILFYLEKRDKIEIKHWLGKLRKGRYRGYYQ